MRIAGSLHQLGRIAQALGEYAEAERLYHQSLEIKEEGNRAGIASTLYELGRLAYQTGDRDKARHLYQRSLDINEELGDQPSIAKTLGELGRLAHSEDDQVGAEKLYRQAVTSLREIGDVVNASVWMFNLAVLYEEQDRLDEAVPLLEQAVEVAERTGFYEAERWRDILERVWGKVVGRHNCAKREHQDAVGGQDQSDWSKVSRHSLSRYVFRPDATVELADDE